jgi:hypothetical protein
MPAPALFKDRFFDYESDDAAKKAEEEIVANLDGALYEDETFPAEGSSLYKNPNQPPRGALPAKAVDWCRINELEISGCQNPKTFIDGASAGDVIQGALGDCWFVSAMSVLGTRDDLLKKALVSDANCKKGIYTFKFSKAGKWRYVHLDDRMPCNKSGKVMYAHSGDANETWVMLMEKAYAKLHGCYENLVSGYIDYGLRDLTGGATMKLKFGNKNVKKMLNDGRLWNMLKGWKQEGSLMGCSLSGGTEHDMGMGILSGHAYGILALEEVKVDESDDMDAFEGKMLKVRNPWGMSEWKGDWCDNDVMWEDYPAVMEKLNPEGFKNDGCFWIEWGDFKEQYNQLFIGIDFPDSWNGRRFSGAWTKGSETSGAGGMPKYPSFSSNPQYTFTVETSTKGVFVLSQQDNRWQGGGAKYKTAVGWVCMKLLDPSRKRVKKFSQKRMAGMSRTYVPMRTVAGQISLEPGRYAVVPTTYKAEDEGSFVLELYTDRAVQYDQEGDELPDLDDMDDEADEEGDDEEVEMEEEEEDEEEAEDDSRELAALAEQVGDLAGLIKSLTVDVKSLEERVTAAEGK